jgi:tetratricopeptide (TPR) repeat protein
MRLFALTGSFDIAAELGDTERLARMERMLRAHELNYSDQWVGQSLLPSQALRLAARGDFDEAFRLLAPTAERQPTDDRRAERFAEIALYAAGAGYLHEARAAIAGALERVDTLQAGMRRTLRVNAILAVALYLVGRRSDARERLQKAAPAEQHASLRTRVLIQALKVLFERWDGAENFDRLLDALEALRTSDFGGIAAVFAALPYRVPVSAA